MRRRRATRGERRAIVLFIGLVMALSYRPGHAWEGLAGGAVAIIVVALFLMIGRAISDANRR